MGFFSNDQHISQFRRYNQIIRVLLKYGFKDVVSYLEEDKRFKFLKKLLPKSAFQEAKLHSKWEKMRLVCEELGPTFVKFGQILSNRTDLLPAPLIRELEKLQDNVPALPGVEAIDVVERELNGRVTELFAWFEQEAFASASMAQVHRATLKSGESVVLKIQRPHIKETIESDIKVMLFMADVFNRRIPSLKSFDPVGLVKNFEESVRRELDFIHESINVQRFHLNFESDKNDHGFIHSPAVFQEFTTSKVLTLEYIDGTKVSDYPRLEAAGIDRKVVARRLADSYFKQVFEYGFFHADPHPGNIFVLKENQICYLDYGMMGNILKKDIEQLATIFLAVRARDVRKIIRALQMLTDGPAIKNYRLLESDLYEFVENNAVRSIHSNELSTLLLELKDIIVKHGLKVPSHFFLLARSLVAIEAVIHGLDPDFDLTHRAKPYFIKAMTQKYDPLKFGKSIFNSIYEMGVYLEEFPRDFKNAIRKINTGEIKVDLHHKGVDPLVHTINRASKQLITAMIIAALIVGSALLIVADEPGEWHAKSKMGVAGLIVAGILAIGLINDLRKGDHDDWKGWDE